MPEPDDNTWMPIELMPPPADEAVEWCRRVYGIAGSSLDAGQPFVATWREFRPEFNVAGLHWRPLGVRLHRLGLWV